ncbi:hypothetical protein EJ082_16385 [Brevundimonas diminuta]|jgi:hypothetical protein|uniref:hypothetical protein n=1 Tax=Brevundimonas diminuta TaxID=293 RepID=UPI00058D39B5|nr:hypothetical protein [Brevundimonas diminuta]MBD3574543.1 hypothetical protein [Brevundimonas diminuta]OMG60754.1 hypothetical protein BJP32_01655 [Brevundimonas sp. ZS04]OWR24561.1 hypothetical protein CD944_01395 [Brevundimonas diminuta]HCQ54599.1 hypothetical protein [Brevundimonas diminuta]
MPPTLPHIAIILNTSEIATALLVSLYKLTGDSLADIKAAVTGRRPVVQEDLFSNAFYDDGISRLRAIVALLQNSGVEFDIYEIGEGERYDDADLDRCRITSETLGNILSGSQREPEQT